MLHCPDAVMHLAAESHVDRSIDGPGEFITTNVVGTYNLLEASRVYWGTLSESAQKDFRFHHISTDEVYGDLGVVILNALEGNDLPVYGDGSQIRDWLYVEDHARALYKVVTEGIVGETYNIGGHNERRNIDVVTTICDILDELVPNKPDGLKNYRDLIVFVKDRPGHDVRYAIDATKIERELGWVPIESFDSGIRKTVEWYLANESWWQRVKDGSYQGERLGAL